MIKNQCTFIEELVYQLEPKSYLELGVYDGTTLIGVSRHVNDITGVDIKDVRKEKVGNFYLGTTDNFFKENKSKFDMIYIDADHSFDSVKKDFENAVSCLNYNGVILLHDTDPRDEYLLQPGYCNDSYKILEWIDKKKFDIVTLPITDAGLTIVKRVGESRVGKYV